LTGFLEGDALSFVSELWQLLVAAQASPTGVPLQFSDTRTVQLAAAKVRRNGVSLHALCVGVGVGVCRCRRVCVVLCCVVLCCVVLCCVVLCCVVLCCVLVSVHEREHVRWWRGVPCVT
jgi:hypothetical protein